MKLTIQITAPLFLAASAIASGLTSPSKTVQARNEQPEVKVVIPPGGTWSKAGPMIKRSNNNTAKRAVPFGKVPVRLLVRSPAPAEDDDLEFVDCTGYVEGEDDGDDDEQEAQPQGQIGSVGGAPAPSSSQSWTPSSSTSESWTAPSSSSEPWTVPSSSSQAEAAAPTDIDWSQYKNPKIMVPAAQAPSPEVVSSQTNIGQSTQSEASSAQAAPASSPATALSNPENLAPKSLTVEEECIRYHTVIPGDVCLGMPDLSKDIGLTVEQFYEYNPIIDESCSNLQVGWAVCIGKAQ